MKSIYAVGMILSTIAAVVGALMVALVFIIGPIPQEPPGAPQTKLAVFGAGTALLVASAIFCGIRLRRVADGTGTVVTPESRWEMNWFDKCCAALAVAFGVALILLGVAGLFHRLCSAE